MTEEMDLRRTLASLRRQWHLIVGVTVVLGVVAFTASAIQHRSYTSASTLLYQPTASLTSQAGSQDPTRIVTTLAVIPTTSKVLAPAAKALGVPEDVVRARIHVASDSTTNLITIVGTGPTAAVAKATTDAVASEFVAWRTESEKRSLESLVQTLTDTLATTPIAQAGDVRLQLAQAKAALANVSGDVSIVEPAALPTAAASPKPLRNLIIGLMAGLFLGVVIALIRDRFDRHLLSVSDTETAYGLALVGAVPVHEPAARGDRGLGLADFRGPGHLADAYRAIRTNLVLYRLDGGAPGVILITSAVAGEGKSAVTANLAAALASGGRSVLAISGDLRAPALHEYFPETTAGGVLDALTGSRTLASIVGNVEEVFVDDGGALDLLANDGVFADPAALLGTDRFADLLREARETYEVVVIDAPPISAGSETAVLAQQADAVVVVARLDRVTRDAAGRALAYLDAAGVRPLGLIVTGVRETGDGYGYGYGASEKQSSRRRRARPAAG
jgi:non-specific protein-tyrosine kinase